MGLIHRPSSATRGTGRVQSTDLGGLLATLRERIGRHQRQGIGEQDTKAALIVPVLRALGWDVEDLEEVKLEYRRRSVDNPVDYALFVLRTPRLFIEAKALGSKLDDGKWASQILAYAMAAGVEWVALTDGNEWRIYNSHATVPVEQKLFRAIRVSDSDGHADQTLGLLAKAQMAARVIDDLWKSDFVDRQITDALGALFASDPDPAIVRILRAKAPALSPAEVRASLGRLRTTFDFPTVLAPPVQPVEQPVERKPTRAVPTTKRVTTDPSPADGRPWRHVTLAQLIESGIVRVPFDIEHLYLGAQLKGRIEGPSRIVFAGETYESLSMAGGLARKSVAGAPTGREYPPTNGWTFWQYRQADGALRYIDELRRDLYERKVVPITEAHRQRA